MIGVIQVLGQARQHGVPGLVVEVLGGRGDRLGLCAGGQVGAVDPRGGRLDRVGLSQERSPFLCDYWKMLIQPLYLNEKMLTDFLASIEGGVRQTRSSRSSNSKGRGAGLSAGPVKAEGKRSTEEEVTVSYEDHSVAGLQRLLDEGEERPEELDWVRVDDPNAAFSDISVGSVIQWECDVYTPELFEVLSNPAVKKDIEKFQRIASSAEAFGLDVTGLPGGDELNGLSALLDDLDVAPTLICEDTTTDHRTVGTLDRDWIRGAGGFDDRAWIVAKVRRSIDEDHWYPYASLPGMNLINRSERRRRERLGPQSPEEESQFLHGPLLIVDYLAVYT